MANPPRIRNYQDLRYKFIRGLIRHEHQQRRHQFLKQAAEWTSKAIVSLSLASEPIRSAKQATQLEGVGATIRARLDKIVTENTVKNDPPAPGKHASTGAGLLVAMLNESEAIGSSEGGKPLVPETDLREACLQICEEKFNTAEAAVDGAPVLCTAWWRINVLISRGYVKKRTRGRKAVFELLPEGEEIARRLRGNHLPPLRIREPKPPQTPGNSLAQSKRKATSSKKKVAESSSSSTSTASTSRDNFGGPLYCHDNGNDGVVMLVDNHELGGDRVRLGELSRRLKDWNVQHKTTHLPCGDYMWLWRQKGKEITLPMLVERKRADDLAESIKDGRFYSQKIRMIQWRKEFGILSDQVSLHYIVESNPEAYRVQCMDGCDGVGKCGNPTVEQLEVYTLSPRDPTHCLSDPLSPSPARVVISELEKSPDFLLIRTENIETTVDYLSSVTVELQQRAASGDFEALRLMKEDGQAIPNVTCSKAPSTSSLSRVSSTKTSNSRPVDSLSSLSKATSFTRTNDVRNNYDTVSAKRDYACVDDTLPRFKREEACSSNIVGSKRRSAYVAIDIDDVIDDQPKKIKAEFVDLCDSQDDDLLLYSPFENRRINPIDNSTGLHRSSSNPNNRTLHDEDNRKHSSHQATNQQVQTDEEAKIMSIRNVMPHANLDDVLSALSSARGNVDLAVAMLLDRLSNP